MNRTVKTRHLFFLFLIILVFCRLDLSAQDESYGNKEDDIDAFMSKVLERRSTNWDELYNYIFSERETLEILGSMEIPGLQSFNKEWTWFVRNGYLVRSPVSIDGIAVSDEYREEYEQHWLKDVIRRKKNDDDEVTGLGRDEFFGFEFEPGNYFYKGRENIDGQELVVVEYYADVVKVTAKNDDEDEFEEEIDKTTLVTMQILPGEHQIVRMTLYNAGFEFLPARWFLRVGEIKASLIMDKPIKDVWMPTDIFMSAKVVTATGDLTVSYRKEYYNYSKTKVKVKYRLAPR